MIGLNDGAGARIQEGVVSLDAYGGIFHRNVKASGVIPQISVIMGPCAGGAVYSPAMTDFVFMVKGTSHMFITGPDVVKTVTGEDVTQEELGGAMTHASKSGVAGFVADDEDACLEQVRYLISFLPQNNLEDPPYYEPEDDPDRRCDDIVGLIPDSSSKPYDMKAVIGQVVDDGDFFEVHQFWAMNIVCGFARLDGHVVGIVGQPAAEARRHARHRRLREGGALRPDVRRVQHPARDVRRRPGLPAGDRPGVRRDHPPRRQAALRVLRGDRAPRADHHPQGLRRRVRGHELEVDRRRPRLRVAVGRDRGHGAAGRGQHHLPQGDRSGRRRRGTHGPSSIEEYTERFANPYIAAERGYVDDVIDPRDTRRVLIRSLEMLRTKREEMPSRKHGNVPL